MRALDTEDHRRVPVNVRIPKWLAEWLREQNWSQGKLIEEALCKQFNLKAPRGRKS